MLQSAYTTSLADIGACSQGPEPSLYCREHIYYVPGPYRGLVARGLYLLSATESIYHVPGQNRGPVARGMNLLSTAESIYHVPGQNRGPVARGMNLLGTAESIYSTSLAYIGGLWPGA